MNYLIFSPLQYRGESAGINFRLAQSRCRSRSLAHIICVILDIPVSLRIWEPGRMYGRKSVPPTMRRGTARRMKILVLYIYRACNVDGRRIMHWWNWKLDKKRARESPHSCVQFLNSSSWYVAIPTPSMRAPRLKVKYFTRWCAGFRADSCSNREWGHLHIPCFFPYVGIEFPEKCDHVGTPSRRHKM